MVYLFPAMLVMHITELDNQVLELWLHTVQRIHSNAYRLQALLRENLLGWLQNLLAPYFIHNFKCTMRKRLSRIHAYAELRKLTAKGL
jgi:hypothetical protein